jgi:ATP-dependent RNA helicase DHX36
LIALNFYGIYLDKSRENNFSLESGGCVLVFLPGENEILEWKETFEYLVGESCPQVFGYVDLFILHSTVPQQEQHDAFQPCPPGRLKIILATNIAESSITIPDAEVIIDFGLRRMMEYRYACIF